jgi:sortase (surface protein transpeptidase)
VATIQKPPEQVKSVATKTPAVTITPTPVDDAQPVHLSVPSIGINAPVEQVGILANGDLATPTRNPWVDTGWYSNGPLPGERGSAVIDGHLDRPGGFPAVFWYLRDVHAGDAVYITEKDGRQLRFHVTRIAYFTPQNAPLQDIFGNNSGIYLNLITCAGDWIPAQHQTTLRLVVYTTLG